MAVHAHPDDEASSTGGILRRYAEEGVRTIVVTCTNGELGDDAEQRKPGEEGHDPSAVAVMRRRELEESCEILRVGALEMLGYHDSGMMGWPSNDAPGAFWNVPVEEGAARLVELFGRYQPDVVVTYDENGFYGHPDHIQANRITRAAIEAVGGETTLYYTAIARSEVRRFLDVFADEMAPDGEGPDPDELASFGVDDELVSAVVDCRTFAEDKYRALAAHKSQPDNDFFLRIGLERFSELFGFETFTRPFEKDRVTTRDDDLFARVRR